MCCVTVESSVGGAQTGGVGQVDGVNGSVEHVGQNLREKGGEFLLGSECQLVRVKR